jgi:hypothetical protein
MDLAILASSEKIAKLNTPLEDLNLKNFGMRKPSLTKRK